MKEISRVFAVAGILLAAYAVVGRFVGGQVVFSYLVKGGIAAGSALLAANTLLLVAVMMHVCDCHSKSVCKEGGSEKSDSPAK